MPEAASSSDVRPRIPAPGEVVSLLSEAAGHRLDLAQLELSEARDHALVSGLLAAVATVLGLLAGLAITLLIAALLWETEHRNWWLAGLCLLYLAISLGAGCALMRRLRQWRPLAETKFQLDQDGQCLNRIMNSFRR